MPDPKRISMQSDRFLKWLGERGPEERQAVEQVLEALQALEEEQAIEPAALALVESKVLDGLIRYGPTGYLKYDLWGLLNEGAEEIADVIGVLVVLRRARGEPEVHELLTRNSIWALELVLADMDEVKGVREYRPAPRHIEDTMEIAAAPKLPPPRRIG